MLISIMNLYYHKKHNAQTILHYIVYLNSIGLSAIFSVFITIYGVVGVSVTFSADPGPSSVVSMNRESGVS